MANELLTKQVTPGTLDYPSEASRNHSKLQGQRDCCLEFPVFQSPEEGQFTDTPLFPQGQALI